MLVLACPLGQLLRGPRTEAAGTRGESGLGSPPPFLVLLSAPRTPGTDSSQEPARPPRAQASV